MTFLRIKLLIISVLAVVMLFTMGLVAVACPTPTISSISPNSGLDNSVITAVIEGTKFRKNVQVSLSQNGEEIIATDVKFISTKKIECTFDLNYQKSGSWDLVVTNIAKYTKKPKTAVLKGAFTIIATAPSISSITPDKASNDRSVAILIKGSNFNSESVFIIKNEVTGIVASSTTVNSAEEATAQFNLKGIDPDTYSIAVTNADGRQGVLEDAFTVSETPVKEAPKTVTKTETKQPEVNPNSLLKSIFFDFDDYSIRNDQQAAVEANLNVLRQYAADKYIVLGGHADERGSREYNIDLSAQRAEAIKQFLVDNGFDASRIIIYAYGKDYPAKKGSTEEAWSFNRRVDVAIWDSLPSKNQALKQ